MEEIAAVYARALFEAARDSGRLDVVREQLDALADVIDGNHSVQVFLFSPYFTTVEKRDALRRMMTGADELVDNFAALLVEKHRMPVIFRIRRVFDELWKEERRLLAVSVTSAVELDERTLAHIGAAIGERTGRTVQLTSAVDPEILGGIVLQVGNSIFDASIRNRLEQLRKHVARG